MPKHPVYDYESKQGTPKQRNYIPYDTPYEKRMALRHSKATGVWTDENGEHRHGRPKEIGDVTEEQALDDYGNVARTRVKMNWGMDDMEDYFKVKLRKKERHEAAAKRWTEEAKRKKKNTTASAQAKALREK